MRCFNFCALLIAISLTAAALGDDKEVSEDQDRQTVSQQEIKNLVEQLGDDLFIKRRLAEAKLAAAGEAAIGALANAANSEQTEIRFRAIDLLKKFYRSEKTRERAQKALEKLRDSKIAGTARAAKSILEEPVYDLPPGIWRGEGRAPGISPGNIVLGNAQSGIKITGAGIVLGKTSQVASTKVQGGQRRVDVIQGSGLGILILDGEKREGIEIHTRNAVDGGTPTFKRYLAKDSDELAKKHPEVFKLYQKFADYRKSGTKMGSAPTYSAPK